MHKRSLFGKNAEDSSPNSLMIRLNSQNTPPRFIQDINKNDETSQYQSKKFTFTKKESKSLDPNRRKIIDKKTLLHEYRKFLSKNFEQNNHCEELIPKSCSTQRICLSKVIGKKYQLQNPFGQ